MGIKKAKAAVIIFGAVLAITAVLLLYFFVLRKPVEETPPSLEPAESITFSVPALVDATPETVWVEDGGADMNGFTTRTALGLEADVEEGGASSAIGVLSIEAIGLECHVYDANQDTVMEAMTMGAAHYKSTSYFSGNVGLSAHNGNASYSFFDRLPQLREGDIITYLTALGEKRYAVRTIVTIADDDWSYLSRTEDNRITLTTCITGQPDKRLCVQGVEIR